MDLLLIGGTRFVGRALVEAALQRGHRLTLFNRGQSNPAIFPEIEQLHGDRDSDLSALSGRRWEAVIDTCAYFPRQVRSLLQALDGRINHYTLISSISAYADFSQPGQDETAPLARIADETSEEVTGETYGGLKVLCEQAAEQGLAGRVLILRPGLIVGPHDHSDRFTYWPARVARGGDILAPDSPDWETQVIDVRDLAEWAIRLVEARSTGVLNATGPARALTFGEVLETCRKVSSKQAKFHWISTEFLLEKGVAPWSELPLWLPGPEEAGAGKFDIRKAVAHGLTFLSLEDTVRDTLDWQATRPAEHSWRAGLSAEREAELLAEWQARARPTPGNAES